MDKSLSLIGFIFTLILFLLIENTSRCQSLKIRNYRPLNQFPVNYVYDVVQDSSGCLWFASSTGILEFDGQEWIPHYNEYAPRKIEYHKIHQDSLGRIWALPKYMNQSVIYYEKGTWKTIPTVDLLNEQFILTSDFALYLEDGNPVVALGTINFGLFIYKNSKWIRIEQSGHPLNQKILSVNESNKNFYVSTHDEFYLLKENSLHKEALNFTGQQYEAPVFCSNVERKLVNNKFVETLWLVGKNWLGYIERGEFKQVVKNIDLEISGFINRVVCVPDNHSRIYFGSDSRIYAYDEFGDSVQSIGIQNGLIDEGATSIFIDREQNVWILNIHGINKIRYSPFKNYTSADGMLENEVTTIEQFDDGTMLLGHTMGFSFLKNGKFTTLPFIRDNKMPTHTRVLDSFKDNNNTVWFTASQRGVGKINSNKKIVWYNRNDMGYYNGIIIDHRGLPLIVSHSGMMILQNNKLLNDKMLYNKDNFHFRKIYELKDSSLAVITTQDGIIRYKNDSVTYIRANNYLANCTYSLFETPDNALLIGTLDGLYFINDRELIKYNSPSLHIDQPVYFIEPDKKNNIWFGLQNGVIKWNGKTARHYTSIDGFPNSETNRSAAYAGSDGKFWIGTASGLSCYIPEYDNFYKALPNLQFLYLEKATGDTLLFNREVKLDYYDNTFTIYFRKISFVDDTKPEFFVKIRQIDEEWSDEFITNESKVRFNNLSPGKYRVGIRVKNIFAGESRSITSPVITIYGPFYQQAWFITISAILISVIALSIQHYISQKRYSLKLEEEIKNRTRKLVESEKNIRSLTQSLIRTQEEERKRISRDLHDNIAQNLSSIKIKFSKVMNQLSFSETGLTKPLSEISSSLDASIKSVREISYDLRPVELDQLGFSESIGNFCKEFKKSTKINLECSLLGLGSIDLNEDIEINLYRIIQECLNNIKNHSGAKKVKISLIASFPKLILRIEDDGIGFDTKNTGQKISGQKRMGLHGINERINLLNGILKISSAQNKGTKIYIEVPLDENTRQSAKQ